MASMLPQNSHNKIEFSLENLEATYKQWGTEKDKQNCT